LQFRSAVSRIEGAILQRDDQACNRRIRTMFVVLFEDDPAIPVDTRKRHMSAHLAFLEATAGRIRAAGPLADGDGTAAGGLWLVDAADVETVEALIRQDPFWPTGLRKSWRVLRWNRVFADGRRIV